MIDIFLEVMRLKTMQNERSWLWKAEPVSEGGREATESAIAELTEQSPCDKLENN